MKPRMIFQVLPEQQEQIKSAAQKLGIGISTYCRMIVLENARKLMEEKENNE